MILSSPDKLRLLPVAVFALLLGTAMLTATSCDDDKKEIISGNTNPETTPTMTTRDVITLVSDSGITRYKITTPLWLMFEEASEPTWRFPEGVHLEKFNARLKPEATIDCDSATYFKNQQLWRLDGYVNIHNTLGEKFLTNQLYWNQRQQKIYSDSFIHIERQGKVIEGYGFESNERMTRYNVLRVSGIFPAEQFKTDSAQRAQRLADDSIRQATPAGTIPFNPNAPHTIVKGKIDDSRLKAGKITPMGTMKEVDEAPAVMRRRMPDNTGKAPKPRRPALSN